MKVLLELSPREALDRILDGRLEAFLEGDAHAEGVIEKGARKAKPADTKVEDASVPVPVPQPVPTPQVIPEAVQVPFTQTIPTAVPVAPPVMTPQVPVAAPVPTPQTATAPIPTASPRVFTRDEISAAGAQLRDAGKLGDLTALLAQFGVPALTELDGSQLQIFAQHLIAMGAKL